MTERPRASLRLKPDPLGTERNPLQVYLLILCAFSGVAALLGHPTSTSITSLHPIAQRGWGTMLLIGSLTALVGMFWAGDRRSGLVFKRFGFTALTLAAVIYGTVLLVVGGWGASLVTLTVYGFAVACCDRAVQVNRTIRHILREEAQDEGLA